MYLVDGRWVFRFPQREIAVIGPTLPIDPMRRTDMPHRVRLTRQRLSHLLEARLWRPAPGVEALLRDAADAGLAELRSEASTALVRAVT